MAMKLRIINGVTFRRYTDGAWRGVYQPRDVALLIVLTYRNKSDYWVKVGDCIPKSIRGSVATAAEWGVQDAKLQEARRKG